MVKAEFDYQLIAVREAFFEGDGVILTFRGPFDLRPMYVMISHIKLLPEPYAK